MQSYRNSTLIYGTLDISIHHAVLLANVCIQMALLCCAVQAFTIVGAGRIGLALKDMGSGDDVRSQTSDSEIASLLLLPAQMDPTLCSCFHAFVHSDSQKNFFTDKLSTLCST